MAFGVEARLPFLDYRLVEYSFGEAAPWRIHDGWTKWILRKAVEGMIPTEIAWRRDKIGFATPELDWLRQWLGLEPDLVSRTPACGEFLDLPSVREKLGEFARGAASSPVVWRWINLAEWLRVWSRR